MAPVILEKQKKWEEGRDFYFHVAILNSKSSKGYIYIWEYILTMRKPRPQKFKWPAQCSVKKRREHWNQNSGTLS